MIVASIGHLQMDILPHLELNYKTAVLLGGSHEYKFECIWSVVGIPMNFEKDGKVLNFSIVWSFVLFPLITNKPCSEPQRCLICIREHPKNQTEYFRNWTTNANVYSFWFMTSIICICNIIQWAALIIYIWVFRVMTHITAAENRKSLLDCDPVWACALHIWAYNQVKQVSLKNQSINMAVLESGMRFYSMNLFNLPTTNGLYVCYCDSL